jgi:hypothetical protein
MSGADAKGYAVLIGVGAVAIIALYYLGKREVTAAVGTVADAINPVNDNNIFSSGVDAVGAKLSGDENWTLGGWIFDVTHAEYVP